MSNKLALRPRLLFLFLATSLLPLALVALVTTRGSSRLLSDLEHQATVELQARTGDSLESLGSLLEHELSGYFDGIRHQVVTVSGQRSIVEAMRELPAAFRAYRAEAGIDAAELERRTTGVRSYYRSEFGARYRELNPERSPDLEGFLEGLDADTLALQSAYIAENPHPLGSKERLERSTAGTRYDELHAEAHSYLAQFLEAFGYYDVFLVDQVSGKIVYSVFKELDFATSLIDGPYADSNIGQAFRKARNLSDPDGVVFVDYQEYGPSYDAPASFVASPVVDGGERLGVLIFQLPIAAVADRVPTTSRMGETAEVFLVGQDHLMRTPARFSADHSVAASFRDPVLGRMDMEPVELALQGNAGHGIFQDYRGIEVAAAYCPVEVLGARWALVAKVDGEEAFASVAALASTTAAAQASSLRWQVGVLLLTALAVVLVGTRTAGSLSRPVVRMAEALEGLARGELSARIDVRRGDELGRMGNAFNRTSEELQSILGSQQVDWAEVAERQRDTARLTEMIQQAPVPILFADAQMGLQFQNRASEETLGRLVRPEHADRSGGLDVWGLDPADFHALFVESRGRAVEREVRVGGEILSLSTSPVFQDGVFVGPMVAWSLVTQKREAERVIRETIEQLASCANELSTSAQNMMDYTAETSANVERTFDGSNEVLAGTMSTTSAAEEMRATIGTIADSSRDLAAAADRALKTAQATAELVASLNEANSQISRVTDTISGIADQTGLLALNATIEAATAGEMGRGFAVVASEVKELALETVSATSTIDSQVGEIQERSGQVTQSVSDIMEVISGLHQLASTIATSVEEQQATMREIAAAAGENLARTETINGDMQLLSETAHKAADAARSVLVASEQLSGLSGNLRSIHP